MPTQIDVELKRRRDLIANLVETDQAYLQHERGPFEAVTTARNAAVSANTRCEVFPINLMANTFHFRPAQVFVIEKPKEREAPKAAF